MVVPSVVACPHCGGQIAADPRLAGQQVACPHCRQPLLMPARPVLPRTQPIADESPNVESESLDFLESLPVTGNAPSHSAPHLSTKGSSYTARKKKKTNPLLWAAIGGPAAFIGLCIIGAIVGGSSKMPKGSNASPASGATESPKRSKGSPASGATDIPHLTVDDFADEVAADRDGAMRKYRAKEIAISGPLSHGSGREWYFHSENEACPCIICETRQDVRDPHNSILLNKNATFAGMFEKVERHPSGYWIVTLTNGRYAPELDNGSSTPTPQQQNREYRDGYEVGKEIGRTTLDNIRTTGNRLGDFVQQLRDAYRDYRQAYEKALEAYGSDHSATQRFKGIADGYRDALLKAGIDVQ